LSLTTLAIDIDGTLIDSRKEISAFTRAEIHRVVREYGAHVILITARGPQSTAIVEEQLGIPASFATFGGSLVWSRESDGSMAPVSEVPLGPDDVAAILAVAADHDVHTGLYSRDDWYVSSLDYWGMREARNTAIWPTAVSIPDTALDAAAGPFFKIMFRGEQEPLAALAAALRLSPTMTYAHHLKHVLEIVSKDAVKLPALQALAAHRGFSLAEVIAFGDSESDLGMLENAGVGVLMGNASRSLPVSDRVERTLSNDEDGIGIALRKHFPTSEPFRP
jgi:Cof subfamily protein (haloacid dehalogenase superfamily)